MEHILISKQIIIQSADEWSYLYQSEVVNSNIVVVVLKADDNIGICKSSFRGDINFKRNIFEFANKLYFRMLMRGLIFISQ